MLLLRARGAEAAGHEAAAERDELRAAVAQQQGPWFEEVSTMKSSCDCVNGDA